MCYQMDRFVQYVTIDFCTLSLIHSVHVYSESASRWKNVVVNGTPPSPRTYHTNSACVGDRLYVFSGGEAGAAPVSDTKLHVFDTGLF